VFPVTAIPENVQALVRHRPGQSSPVTGSENGELQNVSYSEVVKVLGEADESALWAFDTPCGA
jgi:hypothetical protein